MHCLDSEFQFSDLQLDPVSQLLLTAAKDIRATTECVAVHHLRLTPGIFRLNGRLGLPVGISGERAKNPRAPIATQVYRLDTVLLSKNGRNKASCCWGSWKL